MKIRNPKSEVGPAETHKLKKGVWESGTQELRNEFGFARWNRFAGFLSGFPEFLIPICQAETHKLEKSNFEFLSFGWVRSVAWILPWVPVFAFAADTNKIPALKPPLPELPPTFWEAFGWQVVIGGALALLVFVPLVRKGLRRLAPKPVSPENLARQSLEALREHPDDVATATEVARHLRRYTQAILALPPGELTTEELLVVAGSGQARIPAELHKALASLLRECDARHFAPVAPVAASSLVPKALKIADQLAAHRQSASASSAVVSESAGMPKRP